MEIQKLLNFSESVKYLPSGVSERNSTADEHQLALKWIPKSDLKRSDCPIHHRPWLSEENDSSVSSVGRISKFDGPQEPSPRELPGYSIKENSKVRNQGFFETWSSGPRDQSSRPNLTFTHSTSPVIMTNSLDQMHAVLNELKGADNKPVSLVSVCVKGISLRLHLI